MHKHLVPAAAAAFLALSSASVLAHEQGDIVLRAGIAILAPDTSSDPIVLPPPVGVLPNGVDVDTNTQLSLMGTWMMSDQWGLELLASTPFQHDIDLNDAQLRAGSTKHLPPTVTLQWYPLGGREGWQPYIGLGANYTAFFSEEINPALADFLGDNLGVSSAKLSLEDSVGLSASAGVDIPINERWMFNLGIWYIDIRTEAEIDVGFADGSAGSVAFDVDIDPWVYNIGIAYKF